MQPIVNSGLSSWEPGIFSLTIYSLVVLVLISFLFFLSSWLGEKKPGSEKLRAYESGIIPSGSARLRYPVPFFLVAIFFLLFDVEGAFIFSWAVACKTLGWAGWMQMTFFITMLFAGLIYIWKKGGLEWGPSLKKD